jgi:hypothetical protein
MIILKQRGRESVGKARRRRRVGGLGSDIRSYVG